VRLILTILLFAAASRAQDLIQATDYGYLFFKFERGSTTPPPQVLTLDTDEHRPLGIVSVQGAWLHVLAGSDACRSSM
jgi:hypothetical protein